MNSKAKGKRGELEFSERLRGYGFEARRGVQYAGHPDAPDVVTNIPGIHFEVKRRQRGNVYTWIKQAKKDAGDQMPVIASRQDFQDWLITLTLDDFIHLIAKANGIKIIEAQPELW